MQGSPQMSIFIDRAPEDVFAYVLDIERSPEWRPRMSEISWADGAEPGVGTRFRVKVKMLRMSFAFDFEVTAYEPPRYFAYRQETGLVKVDGAMEWLSDGDGCRFFIGGDNRSDNLLMKLATPMFRSSLLWQNYNDLLRLKAILEGRPV